MYDAEPWARPMRWPSARSPRRCHSPASGPPWSSRLLRRRKTHFVGTAAASFAARGARGGLRPDERAGPRPGGNTSPVGFRARWSRSFPRVGRVLPGHIRSLANVRSLKVKDAQGSRLVVGTIDKLGWDPEELDEYDVLLMDEAFQTDAGRYYGVGSVAPTHLLVGDPGQLDPFSTMDDPDRWHGLEEDPLQTAVGILLRNHPETAVFAMPVTRRLSPNATRLVRAFYPGHAFGAAVLEGVRELRLTRAAAAYGTTLGVDQALDEASRSGWAYLVLPRADVLTADPDTIELIVGLLTRLLARSPQLRDERNVGWRELRMADVAVAVSHNDQKDYLRVALDAAGLGGIVVNTANKLQGLQFEVVVAWHPLAGLPDADGFHLDPGRLCVMLTRHRQACIVVGRASDQSIVDGLPPTTPAYLGWDPDPVLDGWEVHQSVFAGLADHRVDLV